MSLRRLFRAPVPISLLFVTLAIFALLVAPSIDSHWERGEATRHNVRLGVFEYFEIDLGADPRGDWTFGWHVEPLPLLATIALTVPLVLFGRRSLAKFDRLLAEEARRRA